MLLGVMVCHKKARTARWSLIETMIRVQVPHRTKSQWSLDPMNFIDCGVIQVSGM
jgi:hypothetical protein